MHIKESRHTVNGVTLNVRDQGQGEPTLLFLHYWGGSGRTWMGVIDRLAAAHRCVAPDQRGWGESDKNAAAFDLPLLADDATALIQRLGLTRYVLVGHSMGGKVAQLLASRRPAGLEALILVAPAPPAPMAILDEQRRAMTHAYDSREAVETALEVLAARPLNSALREQVIADSLCGAPAAKRAWPERGMTLDLTREATRIAVPTLVIGGEADRIDTVETLRREVVGRIDGATLLSLPSVGHLSPLEAPAEVAAAIHGFLDGARPG